MTRSLTHAESVGWRLDSNPRFRRKLMLVLVLDRAPDREALRKSLRHVAHEWHPLEAILQSAVPQIFPPKLERRATAPARSIRKLPSPRNRKLATLLLESAPLLGEPFRHDQPLWNAWETEEIEDGCTALILTLHPLVAGNLSWLSLLLDSGRDPDADKRPPLPMPAKPTDWFRDFSADALREINTIAQRACERVSQTPHIIRAPRQTLENICASATGTANLWGSGQQLDDTQPAEAPFLASLHAPWSDLIECARVTRSTPPLVVTAAIANALRSLRGPSVSYAIEDSEFPWLATRIPLKSTATEPRQQIHEVRNQIENADVRPPRHFLPELTDLLDALPQPLLETTAEGCFGAADFRCETKPGLPVTAFLAGAQIQTIHSFQTTRGHRLAASLTRSIDQLTLGLTLDARAFPEPEVVSASIRDELQMLLRLAG